MTKERKRYLNDWTHIIRTSTDAQLKGVWEMGVDMDSDEYAIWLEEIRDRGLVKEVFG